MTGATGLSTIDVIVVEPIAVLREALHALLQTQSDFDVIALPTPEAALPLLVAGVVLVLSIDRATEATWRFIDDARYRTSGVTTVLLSMDARPDALWRALSGGVHGFIDKRSEPATLLLAIREVAVGRTVVVGPGGLAQVGVHAVSTLTGREVSVLELVGRDLTSQQIASRMGLSIRTIHAHLQNAYRKLGVGSRMAAVAEATRRGEITPGTEPWLRATARAAGR